MKIKNFFLNQSARYLCLLVLLINLKLFPQEIRFKQITSEEGLSQNTIHCIYQDQKGFMWFGTQEGLNRYDGYNFLIYQHQPADTNSIPANDVWALTGDADNNLWIGTPAGLSRFDPSSLKFTNYQHQSNDPNSIRNNTIRKIIIENKETLWLATANGIDRFDAANQQFTHITLPENSQGISNYTINTLYCDSRGTIWAGTSRNGVFRLEAGNFSPDSISNFGHNPANENSLINDHVWAILEDRAGNLWFGTEDGLDRYHPTQNIFTHFRHAPGNPASISHNFIWTIFQDDKNNIWVGTRKGGLNLYNPSENNFQRFEHNIERTTSIIDDRIASIYQDRGGIIWVGTLGGLNFFNNRFQQFSGDRHTFPANRSERHYVYAIQEDRQKKLWLGTLDGLKVYSKSRKAFREIPIHTPGSPMDNSYVVSLAEDHRGQIWIGTNRGLLRYDSQKKRALPVAETTNPDHIMNNNILALYEDHDNMLWIGSTAGLGSYNSRSGEFREYPANVRDRNSISNNRIYALHEDREKNLWIGTAGGLNKLNQSRDKFTVYKHFSEDTTTISSDKIWSLYQARDGNIWAGTQNGLNCLDVTSGKFKRYTTEEGLPNNIIYGIQEDDHANIWISTSKGLAKIKPQEINPLGHPRVYSFYASDGLQDNEFNFGASYKSKDGQIYFGGIKGFNAFYPDSINIYDATPMIAITDFQINNKTVPVGRDENGRQILSRAIIDTEHLQLTHLDNIISFEFAVLDYNNPRKNRFAYYLEGFEDQWQYVDKRHFVTYTNLPAGDYTFHYKGQTSLGHWKHEGNSLHLTIHPPFWKENWFLVLVFLSVLSLVYGAHLFRLRWLRRINRTLQKNVVEQTAELTTANAALLSEVKHRERMEEAAQLQKTLLECQAEASLDGILIVSKDEQWQYFNQRFIAMWEYPADIVEKRSHTAGIKWAKKQLRDSEQFLKIHESVRADNSITTDAQFTLKSGRILAMYSAPIITKTSDYYGRIWYYRDITERIKNREEREYSLSLLQATLEATVNAILVVNNSGEMVLHNQNFLKMWDIPQSVMESRDDDSALETAILRLENPDAFLEKVRSLYDQPDATSRDELHFKDGRIIDRYSMPQNVNGKSVGRVWSFFDVTEQKTLEAKIREYAESLEKRVKERTRRLNEANQKLKAEINEHISTEQELIRSQEQLRNLTHYQETVREEERTRIAREIHDDLGQVLSGLKMEINLLKSISPDDNKNVTTMLQSMSDHVKYTIERIRKLSQELRPSVLDNLGLVSALHWQGEEFQKRANINVSISVFPPDMAISGDLNINLFRIFQESLTNIYRHAQAKNVQVELNLTDSELRFSIVDDGIGIQNENLTPQDTFGLTSIRERVRLFKGTLDIKGEANEGTSITIKIPYNKDRGIDEKDSHRG